MAISEKQHANISKLCTGDKIEIMLSCADSLGLVSVSEYAKIMCIKNRRDVYRMIENGTIKPIIIGKEILIAINA